MNVALRNLALAAAAVLVAFSAGAGTATALPPRYGYGEVVDYPLVFPVAQPHVLGGRSHFWDQRYNGDHHAQDIMADKMTEVYAVAAGTVTWIGSTCCTVTISHDDGWETHYLHLNNDLDPEADDGQGWGIAPGVVRGSRVERGQLIGWVGDSGNAEDTDPHLHFELWAPGDVAVDSFKSLQEAEAAQGYSCDGRKATRVDTNGDHRITGTLFDDVIVATAEADVVAARAGDDVVCGGDGDDLLSGGPGDDLLLGEGGADRLRGGPGADTLRGGSGRDFLVASPGSDTLDGGSGRDAATFAVATAAVTADLSAGTAAGGATATLTGVEVIHGSPYADALTGDDRPNVLLGKSGDDLLDGAGGDDRLAGGPGDDTLRGGPGDDLLDGGDGEADQADGGDGWDSCRAELIAACEG